MTKDKFLSALRRVIRHQAAPRNAQCLCGDYRNEVKKKTYKPTKNRLK